ncbi:hypothetical protein AB1K91_17780 [Terribacillus sp. 179-K 1B1 HS]|uniref:hypothetical protein n=1 Tax=Terribacillus sp. 179-K 1B1 HS TaxID=3142388 RepID=UPI0039A0A07B
MTVKIGDKIRIVNCDDPRYENGDILIVSSVRSDGAVYAKLNGRQSILVLRREFEIVSEQSDSERAELKARLATIEERIAALEAAKPSVDPTPIYRKVTDRSPQVGDYVKYDDRPHEDITAGKYYEIIEIDSSDDPHFIDEAGDKYDTAGDDFEVYEKVSDNQPAEPTLKEENTALRVGDYAKVIREDKFEVGEIIELVGVDSLHFEAKSLQREYWHYADKEGGLVPATDEEVAEAKAKLAASQFEVGDKVRLLSGAGERYLYGFSDGSICEIIRGLDSGGDLSLKNREGISGYAKPDQLEKISDEEAQQIEADHAIAAKFVEIGRKPGEFKAGDIVCFKAGDIVYGELSRAPGEFIYGEVKDIGDALLGIISFADGNYRGINDVELITPVERRFDR